MVQVGEYIDYLLNMPNDFQFSTELEALRDVAAEIDTMLIRTKYLEEENTALKARLAAIEKELGLSTELK
ncbi:hypothetical protein [Candidatus Lokiarchaeum ossiferum]|uniref:hypothetical protein n=1 Tax=Candidatus Lokiarchaeum ossiferum TaxID=2951803 RepID=UPI00352E17E6